jgi:hypothetical protein
MMKNAVTGAVLVLPLFFSMSYGQVGVKGRVVDNSNKAIQGAQVKLITANKTQTTDQNGNFFIDMTSSHVLSTDPVKNIISFHNGMISFKLPENPGKIQIEVFDNKGQRVKKVVEEGASSGTYSLNILPDILPAAMYFVKLQIGNRSGVFNVVSFKNSTISLQAGDPSFEKAILKKSATASKVIDTLKVSKDSFKPSQVAINSYTTNVPDIILLTDGSNVVLPPITNGKSARTTRYWDCCKPACGWKSAMRMCDINGNTINDPNAQSGCSNGNSFQCFDYAPIEINDKVSYGWAAFNNSGTNCGDCFQLAFSGALQGKGMIVQAINIGDGGTDAFDLLIPGGGVGALNGCSRQWNNAPLGVQYGGFRASCGANKDCITGMCQKAFGNKPDLMRGCNWYCNWFGMADNPGVTYVKVSCPKEIKDISKIGN